MIANDSGGAACCMLGIQVYFQQCFCHQPLARPCGNSHTFSPAAAAATAALIQHMHLQLTT